MHSFSVEYLLNPNSKLQKHVFIKFKNVVGNYVTNGNVYVKKCDNKLGLKSRFFMIVNQSQHNINMLNRYY